MNKSINYLALLLFAILMNSCASVSGLEEGRTVGDGNSELIATLNYNRAPAIDTDDTGEDFDLKGFPNIDVSYKYGVMDKLDVGGRITTNLNTSFFAKYQLVGDKISPFGLSAGLELATALGFLNSVHIPINASFYPNEKLTINLAPKFIYQFATSAETEGITYLGGNVGILIGRKNKFGLDFGYFSAGQGINRLTLLNFGLGGKFRFGDFETASSSSDSKSNSTRKRKRR